MKKSIVTTLALMLALMVGSLPAFAQEGENNDLPEPVEETTLLNVMPSILDGKSNDLKCSALGYNLSGKIEVPAYDDDSERTVTVKLNDANNVEKSEAEVTYTEYKEEGDGKFEPIKFDWKTVPPFGIDIVIVKASDGAYEYDYVFSTGGEATADEGVTSVLKDLVSEEYVYYGISNIQFCYDIEDEPQPEFGNIVVVKEVVGGTDTDGEWTFNGSGQENSFQAKLGDGEATPGLTVPVGEYTITETEGPPGYIVSNIECNNGVTSDENSVTVSVSKDQLVTCIFYNKKQDVTAITLAAFAVEASNGQASIAWETGTEINNAGFNIYRAASPDGPWLQVNSSLIAAEGDPVSGMSYTFTDAPGRGTHYYRLEDIDLKGVSTLHQPASAQFGPAVVLPFFRPSVPLGL